MDKNKKIEETFSEINENSQNKSLSENSNNLLEQDSKIPDDPIARISSSNKNTNEGDKLSDTNTTSTNVIENNVNSNSFEKAIINNEKSKISDNSKEAENKIDNSNLNLSEQISTNNPNDNQKSSVEENVSQIKDHDKTSLISNSNDKLMEGKKDVLEKISSKPISEPKKEVSNISNAKPVKEIKAKTKPIKELPIEKKPFEEFINNHLIPEIKNEFKNKGKNVIEINLKNTTRPIAEDVCWVIYCEVENTCNFWLSFEKNDISSLKSFSLCKNYEKPSILESFLIDEKKITLKLIISRILQRLNGQKLIGAN